MFDRLHQSEQIIGKQMSVWVKKDFLHRLRISRKEAKETTYWLELIVEANPEKKNEINFLLQEIIELRNILSSIIKKSE